MQAFFASFANGKETVVPLYAPSREKGTPECPQTLRCTEKTNHFSAENAQSKAEGIPNRSAQQKSRRTKSAAALRGVTSQPALCDDPPHTGQVDPTQQMLQYDQHGILLSCLLYTSDAADERSRLIRPSRCSNTISMVFSFQTVRFSRTAPSVKTEAALQSCRRPKG